MCSNYEPDYSFYEPEPPERYHYIEDVCLPVIPSNLALRVEAQLVSYGLVVPGETSQMVEDLCKGFNQCIRLNNSSDTPQTYVYSPKTGSAKSVTAKMYISMLRNESSIVIVSTVADALQFCTDINTWSGDASYARCYYSISGTNPNNPLRVEKQDLSTSRCIVITHKMFILENNNADHGYFQQYMSRARDLVIVDERIALYNRYRTSEIITKDLVRVFKILESHTEMNITADINALETVVSIFSEISENIADSSSCILSQDEREGLSIPECSFTNLIGVLDGVTNNIHSIVNPIRTSKNSSENKALREDIKMHLKSIEKVMSNDFSFHKSGLDSYLMATENIISKFGSSVILDATATVNEIYKTITWHHPDTFKHIATEDPRRYDNFTIYKAKGFPQGKSSIYEGLEKADVDKKVVDYLSIARGLLTTRTDKLLIVCHKDFMKKLKAKTKHSRILFTNWGNHVGKNNWSHCNKVMVIGWQYLPRTEYYGNFINAVGNHNDARKSVEQDKNSAYDVETVYRVSQLADDLVQAVNRISVRRTKSVDGNCEVSEAYIFYPDDKEGDKVMELFEGEFTNAKVKNWKLSSTLKQKVKANTKHTQMIMAYLRQQKAQNIQNITQATLGVGIKLSKAIVSRTLDSTECQNELTKAGYTVTPHGPGKATIIGL